MSSTILQGSVFDLLPTIAPGSVDCVITSPPYWRLRSYLPQSHALKPQELGSEKTPAEFVRTMVRVFGLVRETMADHAVAFVNVGDTYSGSSESGGMTKKQTTNRGSFVGNGQKNGGIEYGNLCLIPQRLAIALQDDGWYLRSIIAWHKPAPMPGSMSGWRWERCRVKLGHSRNGNQKASEHGNHRHAASFKDMRSESGVLLSLADKATWSPCPGCPKCSPNDGFVLRRGRWRPTSAWEPILMLAKSEKYFCDGEACKTPAKFPADLRKPVGSIGAWEIDGREARANGGGDEYPHDASQANLRDVWTIAAEPLHYFCFKCMASCRADGKTRRCPRCGDKVHTHFAAFPTELVYRCLASGTSSRGYCTQCGLPWVRMVETEFVRQNDVCESKGVRGNGGQKPVDEINGWQGFPRGTTESKTLGWKPSCRCNADARPGLVLDPFAGSGRTGIQCARMGLDFIGIELSPDNAAMARALIREEMPLFA